jgi:predicted PurR-regulated permease PerM
MAVILLLAIACIEATSRLFSYLEPVLLPVLVAALIAYIINPIVTWLTRKAHFSRVSAVVSVMGAGAIAIIAFFMVIVPPLIEQTNQLVDDRDKIWNSTTTTVIEVMEQPMVSGAIDKLYKQSLRELSEQDISKEDLIKAQAASTPQAKLAVYLDLNSSLLISKIVSWLTSGGQVLSSALGIAIGLLMTPIFLFYFLKESDAIQAHWHNVLPIKSSSFKDELIDALQEINGYLIAFFRGQMLVSLIDGTLVTIGLWILGLPYAIPIGVAVAILGVVPYVGTIITIIPTMLIAWFAWHDWQHVVWVVVIFSVVSQLDGWLIQPRIVGDSVGLHPLTVMFSVLFWTLVLGGLLGALLAVPMTAGIKVLFRRYIWKTSQDSPAEPTPLIVEQK